MNYETVQGMWEEYLRCLQKAGAIVDENSAEVCKANFYAGATSVIAMLDHSEFMTQCSFRFWKKFMEMREEIRCESQKYVPDDNRIGSEVQ